MAVDAEIARRLRRARVSAGYESAAEAADAMDLPYATYAGHENGSSGIPARRISRYAAFFKVNLAWLQDGKGPPQGKSIDTPDILDGLPPDGRRQALEYIEFLKNKFGV